jgi:hypothetical protein
LCAGRHRKQEEQDKEEASVHAFHMNTDAKKRGGIGLR